jgi:hypothetical protein
MGAEIGASGQSPRFIVEALKDPDSGNLDRIQIVKISVKQGKRHEQIFDVAWAGDRKIDASTGHINAIGSTVDLKKATYTNTIGAPHLIDEWTDPQFDAANPAIYYARVLEIPTPRWSTVLAVKSGEPLPEGVPATLQERGWTSPLFYNPPQKSVAKN